MLKTQEMVVVNPRSWSKRILAQGVPGCDMDNLVTQNSREFVRTQSGFSQQPGVHHNQPAGR